MENAGSRKRDKKKENAATPSSSSHGLAPMIAGFSGGVASTTLLLPLDVIKVRMQVNEEQQPLSRKRQNATGGRMMMGSVGILRGIVRHEGILGVYQGWTPAVIGSAVSWGGYFFFYEALKQRLAEHKQQQQQQQSLPSSSVVVGNSSSVQTRQPSSPSSLLTSWDYFVLSCTAGSVMVFLTNPIWLIKTRMQLQMKHSTSAEIICQSSEKGGTSSSGVKAPYNGVIDAVRTIVKEEGFLALYKGTGAALLLTSHGGVQFVVYEFLKQRFHYTRAERAQRTVWKRFEDSLGFLTMGTVSKIIASTATYPLQVIKARLQQRSGESLEVSRSDGKLRVVQRNYSGLVDTVLRIVRHEGIGGFYKGCLVNAFRSAPSAAITFVVYEGIMDYLLLFEE